MFSRIRFQNSNEEKLEKDISERLNKMEIQQGLFIKSRQVKLRFNKLPAANGRYIGTNLKTYEMLLPLKIRKKYKETTKSFKEIQNLIRSKSSKNLVKCQNPIYQSIKSNSFWSDAIQINSPGKGEKKSLPS